MADTLRIGRGTDCKLHRNTTHIKESTSISCSAWESKVNGIPSFTGLNSGAGFNMSDNVLYRDASSAPLLAMITGTGGSAANYNDVHLDKICGLGLWTCRSNLHNTANKTDAQAWGAVLAGAPHNNRNKSATTLSFLDTATGDYTLTDAAYQSMSTTGGRPGVNMVLLNALIQDVTP